MFYEGKVLDAIMGSGKTQRVISDVSKITNPVIYITPLLSECHRFDGTVLLHRLLYSVLLLLDRHFVSCCFIMRKWVLLLYIIILYRELENS